MQIQLNDECFSCTEGISIATLLKQLKQDKPGIALAVNQHIVPRDQWATQQVQQGDHILLFHVIAGG